MFGTESYWDLMLDVPHAMFEVTWEVITGLILFPIGRRFLRRHDAIHHPKTRALK